MVNKDLKMCSYLQENANKTAVRLCLTPIRIVISNEMRDNNGCPGCGESEPLIYHWAQGMAKCVAMMEIHMGVLKKLKTELSQAHTYIAFGSTSEGF